MTRNEIIKFKNENMKDWREYRGEESVLFNSYCRGKEMILSNMYPCFMEYDGKMFNSVDHLYNWLLFDGDGMEKVRDEILKCSGVCNAFKAKEIGRKYENMLNPDGLDKKKRRIIETCHRVKAQCCREFRELLIESEGKNLVEFAYWGDIFWGVVYNKQTGMYEGMNCCGRIMMKVREELLRNK